jgi:hypothetical protein
MRVVGLSLLAATAQSAVCPIKKGETQVVIFHGLGPTAECKQWEKDFYNWLGLPLATLTNTQMKAADCGGAMHELGVKIFAMPGGNAYNIGRGVKAEGKQNILDFINAGGTYVGTCAGFFFASERYWWQGVEYGPGLDSDHDNLLQLYPETEGSITDIWDDDVSPGYALTELSNGLNALYWGGPTRGWKNTPDTSPGTVLFRYTKTNTLAGVHYGNLLLFSAHLEAEEGVGISNSGLTPDMQLANWQERAKHVRNAAGLDFSVPATLSVNSSHAVVV